MYKHIHRANLLGSITLLLTLATIQFAVAKPQEAIKKTEKTTMTKQPIINHKVKSIDGEEVDLSTYRGKALLIVNTASYCGYTRQYADLKALQDQYAGKNFTVLAFPCNDFGGQEPGSPKEIKAFCQGRFEVNFPLFDKVHARGAEKSPLYQTLTEQTAQGIKGEVKWNFTKFLVNTKGEVVARFESGVNPNSPQVHEAIEKALQP